MERLNAWNAFGSSFKLVVNSFHCASSHSSLQIKILEFIFLFLPLLAFGAIVPKLQTCVGCKSYSGNNSQHINFSHKDARDQEEQASNEDEIESSHLLTDGVARGAWFPIQVVWLLFWFVSMCVVQSFVTVSKLLLYWEIF